MNIGVINLYQNQFIISQIIILIKKYNNIRSSKNICFLGLAKDYYGLEIILKSIAKEEYNLIIAGMHNEITKKLEEYCIKKNISHKLFVTGYITREEMINIASESFIGVNITTEKSYTDIVLPSKFYDYILNFTPVLISSNQILCSKITKKFSLGEVIDSIKVDDVKIRLILFLKI